jgi:hypothetical protein
MVAAASLTARVEKELADVSSEVLGLPEVAAGWENEPQSGQASFRLEWSNLMGGLVFLDEACRSGTMSPKQAQRFRALRTQLQEQLPTIRRLDLYLPPWVGKHD